MRSARPKNYLKIIHEIFALCDPCDPIDLAQTCENTANLLRIAAQQTNEKIEMERLMDAVAPWFDIDQSKLEGGVDERGSGDEGRQGGRGCSPRLA